MHLSRIAPLCILAALFCASPALADFELPLTVTENAGSGGVRYISNGVPLLAGQAMETDELHVIGPDGKEAPSQFRVLARWWRDDNSIRWVLVDFVGPVRTAAKATYTLVGRKAKAERPSTPLKVEQTDDVIRVNTGPALFEISRKAFNLLNDVRIDGNVDGRFDESERVVHPDPLLGSVVTDAQGRKYYSSKGTTSVEVVDAGPVRVTVKAKGGHVSDAEGAFKPALYGYEVFITFYADRPWCDVDAIITNNAKEPIGEPVFEDWSVLTRVGGPEDGGAGVNMWTTSYVNEGCPQGGSVLLYQDSPGSAAWQKLTGMEPGSKGQSTFRGYKVWQVTDGGKTRKEVDAGDWARGCAQTGRSNLGAVIAPRHFWEQFPSAIEYGGDGTLRYSMLPAEYAKVHWLEDCSAKGQQFRLYFYLKSEQKHYTAFSGVGRPWAHVVMDDYISDPWAMPSVEHAGKCGALGDLGPYVMNDNVPWRDFELEVRERRNLTLDYLKGNGFGWQAFGTRWEELAGHSPWNYEPIGTSQALFNYMITRGEGWRQYGLRVSRQARDVRAYHIDDQDNLALWTSWNAYTRNCRMESFGRRIPKTDAHPYSRWVWPLPNMEHLNLDEVYDLYLLTGDDRAYRCMRTIGDHGAVTSTLRGGTRRVYRAEGWCFRTLLRAYDITGDKRYEPFVRQTLDKYWGDLNKAGPGSGGAWFMGIYCRAMIMAWQITGDERARDAALGIAEWGRRYEMTDKGYPYQPAADRWSLKPSERGSHTWWSNAYWVDVHAFAYQQTGDPNQLAALEETRKWLGDGADDWLYMLPTSQYMAGPRADTRAPAAVGDLKAEALGGGKVRLTWTAPGDDDNTGTAAGYQLKHADKPILEFVPWPEKRETHVTFWGSDNVEGEPAPAAAGKKQEMTVENVPAGKRWFAIKTRDEQPNLSPISNVVEVEVK